MTLYAIGCQHFGHKNILSKTNRPFSSVEDMNAALIKHWNSVVRPQDTVFILGDFCYRSAEPAEFYESRLNGQKVRIQGNHDRSGWGEHIVELKLNKRKIVLCHYPIEEWNGWYNGAVHFHAHTHGTEFKTAERRGNVGVDAIGCSPINLEHAIDRLVPQV